MEWPRLFDMSQPLGLPEGSVRSIIALTLIATFCKGFIDKLIEPQAFAGAVGSVITFYFMKLKQNGNSNVQDTPPSP